jgi:FAD/FMN-containing dehydrogenase
MHAGNASELLKALSSVLGPCGILTRDALGSRATSLWNAQPISVLALARPKTTSEVSAVLRICHEALQEVVVIGGGTGPVAGAEPAAHQIAISLERMNQIESIDPVNASCIVQAGTCLQTVQEAVADYQFLFPLDLGARGSCTIGGNISTNAGGINVLRYGSMRGLVLGLEAVLADGTVISSMNKLLKNNAGFDLKQLFIGTEGTLGIVTRAVLRLFPQQTDRQTAMIALRGFDQVVQLLNLAKQKFGALLSAYEVMWQSYLEEQLRFHGRRNPFADRHEYYVIIEIEGADAELNETVFTNTLEYALANQIIADAVIAKSVQERRALWDLREDLEPFLSDRPSFGYDVGVPIGDMPAYVETVESNLRRRWPDSICYTMGHIADGNLHFFVKPGMDGALREDCDEDVYSALNQFNGTISAEHGIGFEKRSWLLRTRSTEEIALMRSLKSALDPRGILNPGCVFEWSAARLMVQSTEG